MFARIAAAVLGAAIVSAPAFATSPLPSFRFTSLRSGTLGMEFVNGINNNGLIVGFRASTPQGVILSQNGTRTLVPDGSLRPDSLNLSGQIAGTQFTGNGFRAFVRNPDGSMTFIEDPQGRSTDAFGINDAGKVLVNVSGPNGSAGAMLWQAGNVTPIIGPGGNQPTATDVNNSDVVVGNVRTLTGETQAFRWEAGAMTILGSLGNSDSYASDINDQGDIVGVTTTNAGVWSAFVWRNGVMNALSLPGMATSASAINANGWVVGSYDPDGFSSRAQLWINDQPVDLIGLVPALADFSSSFAVGVNDAGQIVGYGYRNGRETAFLLDPSSHGAVPEPASWAMLIAGFGLIGALQRRRSVRLHVMQSLHHGAGGAHAFHGGAAHDLAR
ncbi:hypothetical protein CAP39_05375 [Sphingomonas sp. IBVSS1]|nr:hypothetical protein CAP39_05375 [Sphingomonas sp. IBVSS1]